MTDVFLVLVGEVTADDRDVAGAGFFLVSDVFVDDWDFAGAFVDNRGDAGLASKVGTVTGGSIVETRTVVEATVCGTVSVAPTGSVSAPGRDSTIADAAETATTDGTDGTEASVSGGNSATSGSRTASTNSSRDSYISKGSATSTSKTNGTITIAGFANGDL